VRMKSKDTSLIIVRRAFVPIDPVNVRKKLKFVALGPTHSRDNGVTFKTLGSSWKSHARSLFSKIFHRLLFGWTVQMYRPNLNSVALPVPEDV